jgi:MFS family permease
MRPKNEPEYVKVKKSLKYSIIDGSFFQIMEGFTVSFMSAYAIYLNASTLVISFLASMPDLLASFFQLLAIKISDTFKSKKKIIVATAFLQALAWIPIMFIPMLVSSRYQGYLLVLLYSLIIMVNYFLSPLWRSLMGDLVPESERGQYFGRRNKITAAVHFIATLAAGFILQSLSTIHPYWGFMILFGVACLARIVSAVYLAMLYERPTFNPNFHSYPTYKYTLGRFIKDLNKSDYGKFVFFVCLFRISVYIASPFFALYELKHLGFSYGQYTILMASEIVASVLFMGIWGKLNDEKGSKNVLIISGLLIAFIPLLYLTTTSFTWLIVFSIFAGGAWAGFNLAVGNFMFDASSPQERVRYTSYYNLFNGISVFIGATIGGFLLNALPNTTASVMTLFTISGIARLAVALFMLPTLHEMRLIELPFGHSFFKYPLIIKPRHRFVQDPFDYYMAYPNRPKKPRPRLYIEPEVIGLKEEDEPDPEKMRLEEINKRKFMERYGPKKP